ncbi:hypothetical protein JCM19235_3395 [Vibrio maritimus]|uniref:Uncharacterized protein n=1 Tax=Vibrio maritimus TaxID=990268 RepID=A0A090S0T0_9VIBR|nr:hypothetical protein JCM19235_3395 [Vibrio maritimus]
MSITPSPSESVAKAENERQEQVMAVANELSRNTLLICHSLIV